MIQTLHLLSHLWVFLLPMILLQEVQALNTIHLKDESSSDAEPVFQNLLKNMSFDFISSMEKSISSSLSSSLSDLSKTMHNPNEIKENSQHHHKNHHDSERIFSSIDSLNHNVRRASSANNLNGLNQILSQIQVNMDDFVLEDLQSPFPAGSKMYGSNFFCTNFQIGSLGFDGSVNAPKTVGRNEFKIRGIVVYCQFDWKLVDSNESSLGNGVVKVDTRNSFLETGVKYNSRDAATTLEHYPPLSGKIEDCDAAIVVRSLDVSGTGRRFFMTLLEVLLSTMITVTIGGEICNALTSNEGAMDDQLRDLARQIDPYLTQYTERGVDTFSAQNAVTEEQASQYLDFTNQQEQSFTGALLQNFIAHNLYGKMVTNPNDGTQDIFINQIIRESGYLTEEGFYEDIIDQEPVNSASPELLPLGVRIDGLDSLTDFTPIRSLAPQTLQATVTFDRIAFDYILRILYQSELNPPPTPTTEGGSGTYVEVPDVDEVFALRGEFSDVKLTASLFAPVNMTFIESLTLNEFLKMDCSTQYFYNEGLLLTQMNVGYKDFLFPEVQSLFAPGLDGFLNGFSQAYREMYQSAIYKALPNYIATTFREEQQLALDSFVRAVQSAAECSDFVSSNPEGFVDFRDLLLSRSDATKAGGSGTQPYGDMISSILESIDGNYVSACDDGSPRINSLLSSEFTMDYSLSCKKSVTDNNKQIEIRRRNLSFENANTFSEPFVVMEPHHQETANVERLREPYIFDNAVTVGVGGENPFRVSMDIDVMVPNDDDEGMEKNLLRVTIDASNLSMSASILAKMVETAFMSLSVDEAVNPYCLLSTIASAGEEAIARSSASVLSLLDLVVSYDELKMEVECVSCENVYLLSLIEENEGNFDEEVKSMIEDVLKSVRTGDIQSWIDGLLEDAEYKCKAANGSIDCMDLIGPSMLRESSEIFFARLLDPTLGTETEPEFFSGDSLDPEEVTPEDVESLDSEDITPPGVTPEDLQDSLDNNFAASTSGSLSTIQLEKYPLYLSFFLSSFSALRRHVVFSNFAFLHVYYKVCNDTSS